MDDQNDLLIRHKLKRHSEVIELAELLANKGDYEQAKSIYRLFEDLINEVESQQIFISNALSTINFAGQIPKLNGKEGGQKSNPNKYKAEAIAIMQNSMKINPNLSKRDLANYAEDILEERYPDKKTPKFESLRKYKI